MKPLNIKKYRIILGIAIFITLLFAGPAINVFKSISSDPMGWQAGIGVNNVIVWFGAMVLGYGYLILQNILAVFGLFFAFKTRRKAFWLLVLPGFIGILSGLLWTGLLIAMDPEWPDSWPLCAVLLIPPVTAFVVGRKIRKNKMK